jgi:hypothetical protein
MEWNGSGSNEAGGEDGGEDDQKVTVVLTDQDSKMVKVIRNSAGTSRTNRMQITPKMRSTAISYPWIFYCHTNHRWQDSANTASFPSNDTKKRGYVQPMSHPLPRPIQIGGRLCFSSQVKFRSYLPFGPLSRQSGQSRRHNFRG